MPINQTFNGVVYPIPVQGDQKWGPPLTRYLVALGTGALAPSGGNFTLTADVNFGGSFGLLSKYFSTRTASPATAGLLRLAKTDTIEWLNNAGSSDNILAVNGSDLLTYNGGVIATGLNTLADGTIWIGSAGNLPVAQTLTGDVTVTDLGVTSIGAGKIVNSQVSNSAAIAYSKLNLTGSITNTDIFSSAAIAYSKLALTGAILNADLAGSITYSKLILTNSIVNADIASAAAIAYSKLAALNNSIVPVTNGSGVITSSTTTATQLSFLDATSSIQTQLNGKQASFSGFTTNGSIYATSSSAIASTAAGTTGQFLGANTGGAPTWQTPSGSGTVNSGTAPLLAYYKTSTNAVSNVDADASMGSHKITNLTNGSSAQDAVAFTQVLGKRILQVVTATTSSATSSTSGTFADTNLTATITPSSTSSTILVAVCQLVGANGTTECDLQLLRGASIIYGPVVAMFNANAGTTYDIATIIFLDSPATTSATTYKTQFARQSGTGACNVQGGGLTGTTQSQINLIEIG